VADPRGAAWILRIDAEITSSKRCGTLGEVLPERLPVSIATPANDTN